MKAKKTFRLNKFEVKISTILLFYCMIITQTIYNIIKICITTIGEVSSLRHYQSMPKNDQAHVDN